MITVVLSESSYAFMSAMRFYKQEPYREWNLVTIWYCTNVDPDSRKFVRYKWSSI